MIFALYELDFLSKMEINTKEKGATKQNVIMNQPSSNIFMIYSVLLLIPNKIDERPDKTLNFIHCIGDRNQLPKVIQSTNPPINNPASPPNTR